MWSLFITPGTRRKLEAFRTSQHPVVVMGRGHSGTRVLAFACAKLGVNLGTSEDHRTGDPVDRRFTEEVKKIALSSLKRDSQGEVREREVWRLVRAAYGYYERLGRPAGLWGWKFPETYLIGPLVFRAFPGVKFIHMVRDGRDLAFKNHLTDDPKRRLGRRILTLASALDAPRHIQAACSWKFQVDGFDRFRSGLPREKVLDLRFEDLCARPIETMSRVCEFLGVELSEDCKRYLEAEVDATKVSQYRENDPRLVREVEEKTRDTLERWGYLPAALRANSGSRVRLG